MLRVLLALFLSASPDGGAGVPCDSVAQCWLDEGGKAIARPKKLRGRPLPKGDCGPNLLWLRNRLTCEDRVCTAVHVGDRC